MLLGREREGAFLNELLNRVRGGHSAAIVVHGEAGVGKTALLNEAFGSPSDLRVLRAAGIESEMELPFAGLQQLCLSMLGHLEHLPGPQADALRTAFGLRQGPPPDRFLVGLAVLSLLSETARQQPLVCVVDDCQWLDQASAQALAFAARWIQAEGVLLAFAAREPGQDLTGIPEFGVRDSGIPTPGRCCARSCRGRSMSRSERGSWPKPGETPWRCSSCPGDSRRPSWRAASACRRNSRCQAG